MVGTFVVMTYSEEVPCLTKPLTKASCWAAGGGGAGAPSLGASVIGAGGGGGGGSGGFPPSHRRSSVRTRVVVPAHARPLLGGLRVACPALAAPWSSAAPQAILGAARPPRQDAPGLALPIGPWPPPAAFVGSRLAIPGRRSSTIALMPPKRLKRTEAWGRAAARWVPRCLEHAAPSGRPTPGRVADAVHTAAMPAPLRRGGESSS